MSNKALLKKIGESGAEQADFILLRAIGFSLEARVYDRYALDDLKVLLSDFENKLGLVDIASWVEGFCNSNKLCAVGDFANERGDSCKLIIERISRKLSIFIFGAGHVGQALALISILLGYKVVVIDDRSEFASRERLPDPRIELIADDFSTAIENLNIGPRSAVVIVTRGHQFDEICLQGVLRLQTSYLGMIGSKRRVVSILKRLKEQGFADKDLKKVHAPIGLSIGARTPQEIAIAILAEIIAEANSAGLDN